MGRGEVVRCAPQLLVGVITQRTLERDVERQVRMRCSCVANERVVRCVAQFAHGALEACLAWMGHYEVYRSRSG